MTALWTVLKKVLKWAALTFFVTFLLLGCGLTWPLEVLVFLLTGWARFLARVLPQVHLNGRALAETVVVIGLLAGGLHGFLSWLWRRWHEATPGARPWPVRWSVSLLALLVLLFGATMASVGLAHHVGWMVTSPEPLVRSSWRFAPSMMEDRAESLCSRAWLLSEQNVPAARIVQALLREPGMPTLLEQMAVIPGRDEAGAAVFLVFQRDPITRARVGGVRCRNRHDVESLSDAELTRVLEAVQAGGGGASTSPM